MSGLPGLGVWFDLGAAGAADIARASAGVCDLVFLIGTDTPPQVAEYSRRFAPLVEVGPGLAITQGGSRLERCAAMTTFSEDRIEDCARLAAARGLDYHSESTARALTDKHEQRRRLRSAAGSIPAEMVTPTTVVKAAARVGPAPWILKPARGSASVGVRRVDSLDDLHACLAEVAAGDAAWLLEPFLEGDPSAAGDRFGDYASVELWSACGTHTVVAVLGKPPLAPGFRERGHFFPSTLSRDLQEACGRAAVSALDVLGVNHGFSHIEVKLTPVGPRIIEVNGRLGGGVADVLRMADDTADPVRWCLLAALDVSPDRPFPLDPRRVGFEYMVRPRPGRDAVVPDKSAIASARRLDAVARAVPVSPWVGADERVSHVAEVLGSASRHDEALKTLAAVDALMLGPVESLVEDTRSLHG